jgi:hypothetical protein
LRTIFSFGTSSLITISHGDLTYFKYPFRRCQSENCLLWFKDKADSSVPKYPVTQCSYCKSLDHQDYDREENKCCIHYDLHFKSRSNNPFLSIMTYIQK